jgi:hypothetical protein
VRATDNLMLIDSALSGNSTAGYDASGGAILLSIRDFGYGEVTLMNSTVRLILTDSTVSGNSTAGYGATGGGIDGSYESGTVTNSVVLGNATTHGGIADDEAPGFFTLTGGNIIGTDVFSGDTDVGDTTATAVFAATAEIAPGVLAGVLADNGGPTRTIAVRPDAANPAIGGADPATATATDQRGVPRAVPRGVFPRVSCDTTGALASAKELQRRAPRDRSHSGQRGRAPAPVAPRWLAGR